MEVIARLASERRGFTASLMDRRAGRSPRAHSGAAIGAERTDSSR